MGVDLLAELQDMLYAQDRWAVLLMFRRWTLREKTARSVRHVRYQPAGLPGVILQGAVAEDLDHDFLAMHKAYAGTRSHRHLQSQLLRGTLVVRVHREFWRNRSCRPSGHERIWKERFQHIRSFERYLTRNGVRHSQNLSHVSNKEQKSDFSNASRAGEKLEVLSQ